MTKWFHTCSLDWLKARQQCLTATDVKELLPVTKTGRPRKVTDESYLKVYARKLANLTWNDCESTGAAARGHILEPYAVKAFNLCGFKHELFHWDDLVLTKSEHQHLGLSFSPDALDVIQIPGVVPLCKVPDAATVMGEVKSYSPEHHLVCGYTPKGQLEERWQVATAMAVAENIEDAYLIFYNPSMEKQLFVVEYDRLDLVDEIDTVLEVEDKWLAWVDNVVDQLDHSLALTGSLDDEQDIIEKIMKSEELNPDGERSVIR